MTGLLSPSDPPAQPEGQFFRSEDQQDFYRILNAHQMRPFLMSIVSAGDLWMYISSNGGLTAGRVNAEQCLFPYQTVDLLHDCHHSTGPITLIRCQGGTAGESLLWQPFADAPILSGQTPRTLSKSVAGNQIVFEETHPDCGLSFRYSWRTSTRFGFVRTSTLENRSNQAIEVELVDGLQNLWPGGVPLSTMQRASCLVDAYKHNECEPAIGLGIFGLAAQIVDKAEAVEMLRATTVWSCGLPGSTTFLTLQGLREFIRGNPPAAECLSTGQRGNYLRHATFRLGPGESRRWYLVADVMRDHQQVAALRKLLQGDQPLEAVLEDAIAADHRSLVRNVASADGLQCTGSPLASAHHFANVLFNNMRGGVFAENYQIDTRDLLAFLNTRNRPAASATAEAWPDLPSKIKHDRLLSLAREQQNADLVRLAQEYLPLTFSRRHGDPSRPWNAFDIHVHHEDGSLIYNYQGNWRDIFQNWEALCCSFPGFLPGILAKFVNASTVDGFNPYRLTRDGIDWETPDPEDPWANIGYWGDHQIVYLTRMLEELNRFAPGSLDLMLTERMFCYSNVPYRLKGYDQIVADSSHTIEFDWNRAKRISARVQEIGTDGKLLCDAAGQVVHVTFTEKLLVPVLAKLSNFVIDGGIWLNTQRPEWNDANNALVGAGLSIVTVCHLRRHLKFLVGLLQQVQGQQVPISREVVQWFGAIRQVFQEYGELLHRDSVGPAERGSMLSALGRSFANYRQQVYETGLSGQQELNLADLIAFFQLAGEYLDRSIKANRRADGLYHAYNLLEFSDDGQQATVSHLYEMLEGQVAVLSSGLLNPQEAVQLLQTMFDSKLYRADQQSFLLYPDRKLPGFLTRNTVSVARVASNQFLQAMAEVGDRSLVVRDVLGEFHFQPAIQRRADLAAHLARLAQDNHWSALAAQWGTDVLDLFEEVFSHKTFTGRSGTMYGYEGLGCIYWHMISKLLLAVQENVFTALDHSARPEDIDALCAFYYRVRHGLSSEKSPAEYGAFPTDPYSHTPKHAGAQQPGMTGQVKEEILARLGELGVRIRGGRIEFLPLLVRRREFLSQPTAFTYWDVAGVEQTIELPARSVAFTLCQVPVVCRLDAGPQALVITLTNGQQIAGGDSFLDASWSGKLFSRSGEIARIDLQLPESQVTRE